MNYGNLLTQSWVAVWRHRFMLILGALAILAGGGGVMGADLIIEPLLDPNFDQIARAQLQLTPNLTFSQMQVYAELAKVFTVVFGFSWIVFGFLLWINSRISEGGLIATVQRIERGQIGGFVQAWMVGRSKISRLAVIGLVLLIPTVLLALAYYVLVAVLSIQSAQQSFDLSGQPDPRALPLVLGYNCINLIIVAPLYLVRTLADRACILEDHTAGRAIRRGLAVFRAHPGPVIVVYLIEIGLRIVIGLVLGGLAYCALLGIVVAAAVPSTSGVLVSLMVAAACCLLPLLLITAGLVQGYSSTLWTLAWLRWSEMTPLVSSAPS